MVLHDSNLEVFHVFQDVREKSNSTVSINVKCTLLGCQNPLLKQSGQQNIEHQSVHDAMLSLDAFKKIIIIWARDHLIHGDRMVSNLGRTQKNKIKTALTTSSRLGHYSDSGVTPCPP